MSTLRRFVLASSLLVAGSVSAATLGPSQRKCQGAIARGGLQLLDRSMSILGACSRDVARGALPPGTRCLVDPATVQARSAAATRTLAPLLGECSDATVAALAPAGDC